MLRDPELEWAYQTLELPYGADLELVKQRWIQLLKLYHPDRYASATSRELELATRKSQELTAAYHKIQRAYTEGNW